jgi:hypothetical protein
MFSFISKLLSNELVEARNELDKKIKNLVEEKVNQIKVRLADELLGEGNVLKMGRTKLIRVRVRKGKVQRRKKFSAVKGYTIRGGKLTRMMPTELRNRKVASRRSKFKRRSKLNVSLRKRRTSLRKRRALGL